MAIPVLVYHKVSPEPRAGEPAWMAVPPDRFAEQIEWLARQRFETISPTLLADALKGRPAGLPRRPVLMTFDDGYLDNHRAALPVLKRHGFAATVFLVGDYVGASQGPRKAPLARPNVPMLGGDEIRELRREGWTFGSHGMSHRRLTQLDLGEARWELLTSRAAISSATGQEVRFLSYPYSDWLPRLSAHVRECGYEAAFTIRKGPVRQGVDPSALRRIPVTPEDTPARLAWKLRPAVRAASALIYRTYELLRGDGHADRV